MIIDCISDLHGHLPQLEGGDLLIIGGDLTARDTFHDYGKFFEWLSRQQYKKKVLIAGNHDGILEYRSPNELARELCGIGADQFDYLCDSGIEFEGLKIYGSPWTPTYYNWYFMKDRGEDIRKIWDLVPIDTDIIITHGPPYGILDQVKEDDIIRNTGCEELRIAIERIQPRLHVFGHIHEGYGMAIHKGRLEDVICVNASLMNEHYMPVNKPIRIIL